MLTGLLIIGVLAWLRGTFDVDLHKSENATARKYRREFPEEYHARRFHRMIYGYPEGSEDDRTQLDQRVSHNPVTPKLHQRRASGD